MRVSEALPPAITRAVRIRLGGTPISADKKPARVLIVEDNEFLAVDLEMTLSSCGYEPTVVGTVSAALQKIGRREVDVAVLDVSLLGGESVYRVADALTGVNVPFVFLTGRNRHHLPPRLRTAKLLSKPYKLAELLGVLQEAGAYPTPTQKDPANDGKESQ